MSFTRLTEREAADLAAPLNLPLTDDLREMLSQRVESAVRNAAPYFAEQPLGPTYEREFVSTLRAIAADPARALDAPPLSEGGRSAFELVIDAAQQRGVDVESRRGAAQAGDLAAKLLEKRQPQRADWLLKAGEATIFEEVFKTIQQFAPQALNTLPSNETVDLAPRAPAIVFAEAFIELVVDRIATRVDDASDIARKRLETLLWKSNRALLTGLRTERQFHAAHASIMDGEVKATIFG